jgi:hypothetical protein
MITYVDDHLKEDEMGGACNTREREAKDIYILAGLSKDLRVDGRVKLKGYEIRMLRMGG